MDLILLYHRRGISLAMAPRGACGGHDVYGYRQQAISVAQHGVKE